jgi:hypothetical protein
VARQLDAVGIKGKDKDKDQDDVLKMMEFDVGK